MATLICMMFSVAVQVYLAASDVLRDVKLRESTLSLCTEATLIVVDLLSLSHKQLSVNSLVQMI